MSDPATRSMNDQCVAVRLRFTLLQATASSGPYPSGGPPSSGGSARQNRWSSRSRKRGTKRKPSILYSPKAMSDYEALSVATISGPGDLVVDGVEPGHAAFVAVTPGRGASVDALDGDDEAQAVDGGEQPGAPHLAGSMRDWAVMSAAFAAPRVSARR